MQTSLLRLMVNMPLSCSTFQGSYFKILFLNCVSVCSFEKKISVNGAK